MIDTAEFVAMNYYNDETMQGTQAVRDLLAMPGIYHFGSPDAGFVLIYMLISDEALALLESKKHLEDFTTALSSELLSSPGENIYIFRCVGGLPQISTRITFMKTLIKKHNAKTICWHDDNSDKVMLHKYYDAKEYEKRAV